MTALDTGLIIAATLGWLLLAVALVKVVEARDERDAAREDCESECADHAKTARERDDWKGLARIYHLARNLAREKTVQALRERDAALGNLAMVLNNEDVASVIDMTARRDLRVGAATWEAIGRAHSHTARKAKNR